MREGYLRVEEQSALFKILLGKEVDNLSDVAVGDLLVATNFRNNIGEVVVPLSLESSPGLLSEKEVFGVFRALYEGRMCC